MIDYWIAYAPFYDAVFGRTNLAVKQFADMAGKSVSVTRGSMRDQEITAMAQAPWFSAAILPAIAMIQAAIFPHGSTEVLLASASHAVQREGREQLSRLFD